MMIPRGRQKKKSVSEEDGGCRERRKDEAVTEMTNGQA